MYMFCQSSTHSAVYSIVVLAFAFICVTFFGKGLLPHSFVENCSTIAFLATAPEIFCPLIVFHCSIVSKCVRGFLPVLQVFPIALVTTRLRQKIEPFIPTRTTLSFTFTYRSICDARSSALRTQGGYSFLTVLRRVVVGYPVDLFIVSFFAIVFGHPHFFIVVPLVRGWSGCWSRLMYKRGA